MTVRRLIEGVLSQEECAALTHRVLSFATADETRVTIESTLRSNTRFADNQISTCGDDVNATITIRSTFGKRSASVTTNKASDTDLAAAVKNAEAIARLSAENSEHMPELGPQRYAPFQPRSLTIPSAADRARAVQAVTARAIKQNFMSSGYLEIQSGAVAIATSRGLFAYDQTSAANMTATVRTPDGTGSGWAGDNADTWSGIDPEAIGARAVEKAASSREPVAIEPGRYTVILEPTAVGNLVPLIYFAMNARSADEGRSFFSKSGGGNKIGAQIADRRVTLTSDPADIGDRRFTTEGLPAEKVVWIENGVLKNLQYDRYWAKKQGTTPTAVAGFTLHLEGETTSIPQMIASTERGVLVTRFWYIRPVDPRTILYTGLTRDGTFLIENGKVTHAIKNFRYNESPIFMLNNVEAFGPATRVSATEDSSPGPAVVMPPLKCRDFTFTSLSDAV
jgi:predicted Zn-dependent protease